MVIASGIVDDQEAEMRAAFAQKGIEIVAHRVERDWIALIGRLPAQKALSLERGQILRS
jgi:ribosomal protein L11 methylase PrmA